MTKALQFVLVSLVLVAVSGLGSAAERIGHSKATFSGGVEEQFSGSAMHLNQELTGESRLLLTLYRYQSDADFTAISLLFSGDTAEPGTYQIREDANETDVITVVLKVSEGTTYLGTPAPGQAVIENGRIDPEANTTAGELIIQPANENTLSGTLTFKGELLELGETENRATFVLEATFESAAGEAEDLPGMLGQPGMRQ